MCFFPYHCQAAFSPQLYLAIPAQFCTLTCRDEVSLQIGDYLLTLGHVFKRYFSHRYYFDTSPYGVRELKIAHWLWIQLMGIHSTPAGSAAAPLAPAFPRPY